jgi:hypothetical protein
LGATQDKVAVPVTGLAAALTVTVALCEAEPPLPLHVKVNLVVALRPAVVCEPRVPSLPLQPPDAVQEVALPADQDSVEVAPLATVLGLAVKLTTGAGALTVTVADCNAVPPVPLQVKV